MMRLWLISQNVNNDYDTYDSAVVCAASKEEARRIRPGHGRSLMDWAKPEDVDVKPIGLADAGIAAGVVCASYNAG